MTDLWQRHPQRCAGSRQTQPTGADCRSLEKTRRPLYSLELTASLVVANGPPVKRKFSRGIREIDGYIVALDDRRGGDHRPSQVIPALRVGDWRRALFTDRNRAARGDGVYARWAGAGGCAPGDACALDRATLRSSRYAHRYFSRQHHARRSDDPLPISFLGAKLLGIRVAVSFVLPFIAGRLCEII